MTGAPFWLLFNKKPRFSEARAFRPPIGRKDTDRVEDAITLPLMRRAGSRPVTQNLRL